MADVVVWKGKSLEHRYGNMYRDRVTNAAGKTRSVFYIQKNCTTCGSVTYVTTENHKRAALGKSFCSRECQSDGIRASNNSNWSGGRKYKRGPVEKGYIVVYSPGHPKADRNGYVSEHRLVAEEELGRTLTDEEFVHHIDCDKENNTPSNLVVVNNWQHNKAHAALEGCVKRLLEVGALRFNRELLTYEVVV